MCLFCSILNLSVRLTNLKIKLMKILLGVDLTGTRSKTSVLKIRFQCRLLRINVKRFLSKATFLNCSSPTVQGSTQNRKGRETDFSEHFVNRPKSDAATSGAEISDPCHPQPNDRTLKAISQSHIWLRVTSSHGFTEASSKYILGKDQMKLTKNKKMRRAEGEWAHQNHELHMHWASQTGDIKP